MRVDTVERFCYSICLLCGRGLTSLSHTGDDPIRWILISVEEQDC